MATDRRAVMLDRDIEMELIRGVVLTLLDYLEDDTSTAKKTALKDAIKAYDKVLDEEAKKADGV